MARPEKVPSRLSAASSISRAHWRAGKSLRLQERLKIVTESSSQAASSPSSFRAIVLSI